MATNKEVSSAKVLILTNSFPFGSGEQYLEGEVEVYRKVGLDFTLCPLFPSGTVREGFSNAELGLEFSLYQEVNISYFFLGLFASEFWGELFGSPRLLLKPLAMVRLLFFLGRGDFLRKRFTAYIRGLNLPAKTILYSYWCMESAYASSKVKVDLPNVIAVSRCHGYDVYKTRQFNGYMPLSKSFIDGLNKVFPCSQDGLDYIKKNYPVSENNIEVSRLGVPEVEWVSDFNRQGKIHIVSCSALLRVKRIDMIIDVIECLSSVYSGQVHWVHIGSGGLLEEMASMAEQRGVEVSWLGQLENTELMSFYATGKIDCFINMSDSEGVPASIMEAISCGIPVVARDVGGLAEIVSGESGCLLGSDPSASEAAKAVIAVCERNSVAWRESIKSHWKASYCGQTNYSDFLKTITSL